MKRTSQFALSVSCVSLLAGTIIGLCPPRSSAVEKIPPLAPLKARYEVTPVQTVFIPLPPTPEEKWQQAIAFLEAASCESGFGDK